MLHLVLGKNWQADRIGGARGRVGPRISRDRTVIARDLRRVQRWVGVVAGGGAVDAGAFAQRDQPRDLQLGDLPRADFCLNGVFDLL